ncbi:hypothetical protein ES703_68116 [subsurface metagenome]
MGKDKKEQVSYQKLNIEGFHPDVFQQFKIICVERKLTMKEVVHSFVNAYIEQALKDYKKKRNQVV